MTRNLLTLTSCGLLLASGLSAQKLKVLDLSRLGHESYLRMQATVPEITQIALRLNASGMTVIGVDPKDMPFTTYLARTVAPDRLDSVLPQADVVLLSAPLTAKSRKMMGPREFELMKPNSYFIAVSRGSLYDIDALVKALDSKKLAGAGLDVTDPEPLPKSHPLWKFPNVLITPHIAGRSDGENARYEALYIEN